MPLFSHSFHGSGMQAQLIPKGAIRLAGVFSPAGLTGEEPLPNSFIMFSAECISLWLSVCLLSLGIPVCLLSESWRVLAALRDCPQVLCHVAAYNIDCFLLQGQKENFFLTQGESSSSFKDFYLIKSDLPWKSPFWLTESTDLVTSSKSSLPLPYNII